MTLCVTAVQFQQMIQYRNGGTTILALENSLPGTSVTNTASTINENYDVLLLAYRQPGTMQVDIVPMMIDEMKLYH